MGNMSYCRFRNTLPDFNDCVENIWDECDDPDEERARKALIREIKQAASDLEDMEG